MKKYYQLTKANNSASISIYGDITSYPWRDSDVSASNLSRQIDELQDVDEISVCINSYGGEVAEGLAIYNALKRHKAKVKTFCDGFAASIASVIFMAGDERIMNDSSLLMIHNAWSFCEGNAKELRKQADDLDKITRASVIAYKAHSSLSEEEIAELMDNESWILPEEAMEYGFATAIAKTEHKNASQNARRKLFELIKSAQDAADEDENGENTEGDKEPPEDKKTAENAVDKAQKNIVCVCGAPCSGKSTYVQEHRGDNDAVYDYDEVMRALTGRALHEEASDEQHKLCLHLRQAFVEGVADVALDTVWVIATRPSDKLKEMLGECEYITMNASESECLANLATSDRPNKELWEQRIKEFFAAENGEEPEPDEPEEEPAGDDEENPETTAAQLLSGLFNAFLNYERSVMK